DPACTRKSHRISSPPKFYRINGFSRVAELHATARFLTEPLDAKRAEGALCSLCVLLRLPAERTAIRARVQRLAAVPAEPRRPRQPRSQTALDIVRGLGCRLAARLARHLCGRRRRHRPPGGEHILEQIAGALVT